MASSLLLHLLISLVSGQDRYRVAETVMRAENVILNGIAESLSQHSRGYLLSDERLNYYTVDREGTLIARWGGKGSGPGQFDGALQQVLIVGDHIHVFSNYGRRLDIFDIEGRLIENRHVEELSFFYHNDFSVSPVGSILSYSQEMSLRFADGNNETSVELVNDQDEVAPLFRYLVRTSDAYVLVCSTYGLLGKFYYAIYDRNKGDLVEVGHKTVLSPKRHETVALARKMSRDASIPVHSGVTVHPDRGFVFPETALGDYRYLRLFNPGSRQWSAMRLTFNMLQDFSHAMPLHDDLWAGYDGENLVVVRIEPY